MNGAGDAAAASPAHVRPRSCWRSPASAQVSTRFITSSRPAGVSASLISSITSWGMPGRSGRLFAAGAAGRVRAGGSGHRSAHFDPYRQLWRSPADVQRCPNLIGQGGPSLALRRFGAPMQNGRG